jgi:hypothetical protein
MSIFNFLFILFTLSLFDIISASKDGWLVKYTSKFIHNDHQIHSHWNNFQTVHLYYDENKLINLQSLGHIEFYELIIVFIVLLDRRVKGKDDNYYKS